MAANSLTIKRQPRGVRRLRPDNPASAGGPSNAARAGSTTAGTEAGAPSTPGQAVLSSSGRPGRPERKGATILGGGGGVTAVVSDASDGRRFTADEEVAAYRVPPRWGREAIRKGVFDWSTSGKDDLTRLMICVALMVPRAFRPVRLGEVARLADSVCSCVEEDPTRAANAAEALVKRGFMIPREAFERLRAFVDEVAVSDAMIPPPEKDL